MESLDLQLALALSQQEPGCLGRGDLSMIPDMDEALALALSMEDPKHSLGAGESEPKNDESAETGNDHRLALAQAKEEHEAAMNASICGRAFAFVEAIIQTHTSIVACDDFINTRETAKRIGLEPIGTDDMLYSVERLMEAQACFRAAGKDTQVDIGYHYTGSANLKNIRTNGLLTKAERDMKGVRSKYNGSVWGDGIYTSSFPFAFTSFGDTGLLVARLRGDTGDASRGAKPLAYDTAIANKNANGEMIILKQSCQCIPLLQFNRPNPTDANISRVDRAIYNAHNKLQKVVDEYLNGNKTTAVPNFERPAPATTRRRIGNANASTVAGVRKKTRTTSTTLPTFFAQKQARSVVPQSPTSVKSSQNKTVIPTVIQFNTSHVDSSDPFSPTFRRWNQRWTPSGGRSEIIRRGRHIYNGNSERESESMRVLRYSKHELQCDGRGTLVVVYSFFKSPGETRHRSSLTHRIAYHPDDKESKQLLERLKDAFINGMIDVTTWPQLLQRTNPYTHLKHHVSDCHAALDGLGVPNNKVPTRLYGLYFRNDKDINYGNEQESESMRVLHFPKDELRCEGRNTFVVVYSFFKSYGITRHRSALTHRIAYHPDTPEDKKLLERLTDAFCNGIIDVACWSQLPQRTSPYLSCKNHVVDCHKALDNLGFSDPGKAQQLTLSAPTMKFAKVHHVWLPVPCDESKSRKAHEHDVIPLVDANGQELSPIERSRIATKKGLTKCGNCGIQTHEVGITGTNYHLTNDSVHKGICIQCNNQLPHVMSKEVEKKEEEESKKGDSFNEAERSHSSGAPHHPSKATRCYQPNVSNSSSDSVSSEAAVCFGSEPMKSNSSLGSFSPDPAVSHEQTKKTSNSSVDSVSSEVSVKNGFPKKRLGRPIRRGLRRKKGRSKSCSSSNNGPGALDRHLMRHRNSAPDSISLKVGALCPKERLGRSTSTRRRFLRGKKKERCNQKLIRVQQEDEGEPPAPGKSFLLSVLDDIQARMQASGELVADSDTGTLDMECHNRQGEGSEQSSFLPCRQSDSSCCEVESKSIVGDKAQDEDDQTHCSSCNDSSSQPQGTPDCCTNITEELDLGLAPAPFLSEYDVMRLSRLSGRSGLSVRSNDDEHSVQPFPCDDGPVCKDLEDNSFESLTYKRYLDRYYTTE